AGIAAAPSVWDEPCADESEMPPLLLPRLARQHVTVALSGDGGDECFGGYARHFLLARMAGPISLPAASRRMAASRPLLFSPTLLQRVLGGTPLSRAFPAALSEASGQKVARPLPAHDEGGPFEAVVTA